MTTPLPQDNTDSIDTLRKRWWSRYNSVQTKYDTKIRTALSQSAQDASDQISALASNPTFSAGVKTAQLRLALTEIKKANNDLFKKLTPIITDGQKDAAGAAADGLSATDLDYLRAAFSSTGDAQSFIKSARTSALLGVNNAISRITKTDLPLSGRVYRSQALANRWVQNVVNSVLLRGGTAADVAKQVRSSILPSTPGGVSYAAMRLGRTELNNAFHATAITMAEDRPWVTGMRWYLSATHVPSIPPEACDKLAGQIFTVDATPPKPHPQCRCFVAPEVESASAFQTHLTAGYYRDWMEDNAKKSA